MDFSTIFSQYYGQYRAEATIPDSSDDEYIIGMRFANDAIRRWEHYDNTFWKELFTTTASNSAGGVLTTTAGTATYAAPTAMAGPGSYIRLYNGTNVEKHIPLVNLQDNQFMSDMATAAYFTGDPNNGFTLNFRDAPDVSGYTIFYDYYKKADTITDGDSKPEMSNPDFIVNHMLASRYRASRNPYYSTAKRDAENMLGQMKMENDSGTWANPWTIPDRSGTSWGAGDTALSGPPW
jgi:hypothetical protein